MPAQTNRDFMTTTKDRNKSQKGIYKYLFPEYKEKVERNNHKQTEIWTVLTLKQVGRAEISVGAREKTLLDRCHCLQTSNTTLKDTELPVSEQAGNLIAQLGAMIAVTMSQPATLQI